MIENAFGMTPKFYFSAPSCVPATPFETSGSQLTLDDMETLLKMPEIKLLGEMMNFPGVIFDDPEVLKKLEMAKRYHKPIDGHSPGLRGDDLKKYISAGITTDHECFTQVEALEKLSLGMKILIREGSAAKNFDDLIPINDLVRRALATGLDRIKVFQMACINPVTHYGLDVGCLQPGDAADFLVIDDFDRIHIHQTVINGEIVAENDRSLLPPKPVTISNRFAATPKQPRDFFVPDQNRPVNIIHVIDGQLITKRLQDTLKPLDGRLTADITKDILKIAVVNRYEDLKPAVGFVRNFGLKYGAIAGSIAHDSHNIIAVGTTDEEICTAVNLIIENKGGICAICDKHHIREILPLPIAGLMSDEDFKTVADQYTRIDTLSKEMGATLHAPFMTLSFMALLVIPEIKLSDKGLFDGARFEFIDLFAETVD
ncbi:MAG: adenine deaminase [Desulfobacteraceae bacterium 4572_87]|nr:MAG: adenine deaminase [Desulfobacteraceae bacterium 4572_87]